MCHSLHTHTHTNSVNAVQSLFGQALEQINLDIVFLEERNPEGVASTHHHSTVAYMLIWKLLIEAMANCQPEVCDTYTS